MSIKLDMNAIKYIAIFESVTGAKVKDCVAEPNQIVFVVNPGQMGLAIGKSGINVKEVQQALGKPIKLFEYSENPEEFIKKLFAPAEIKKVDITEKDAKKTAQVFLDSHEKGKAIGKKGENIQRVKILLDRHHNIKEVTIR